MLLSSCACSAHKQRVCIDTVKARSRFVLFFGSPCVQRRQERLCTGANLRYFVKKWDRGFRGFFFFFLNGAIDRHRRSAAAKPRAAIDDRRLLLQQLLPNSPPIHVNGDNKNNGTIRQQPCRYDMCTTSRVRFGMK